MRILHIDTEMTWRGGENQLRLLLEGLNNHCENHVALRPDSAAAARLESLAPLALVPMRGGFDPVAAYHLAQYCRKQAIDLIDAHTANGHGIALLIRQFYRQPHLVVHRRVDFAPRRDWLNRRKYLSPRVDRYVAISNAIAGVLGDYGIAADRIRTVRSAVPTSAYRDEQRAAARANLAQAYGIDPALSFVGNASALTEQKGYEVLLNAAALLKAQGSRFHLFIAGDGPLLAALEQQRIALALDHHVTFLGFISEVPRLLSGLDILAVSSHFEGLGTILLDGLAAGLAVAATAVGGIPEVIIAERTGLLSPDGDAAGLAANLTRLIGNQALRHQLVAAGRAHIAKNFSVEAMVAGNLAVYRELCPQS